MKAFLITLAATLLLSPGFAATAAPPKIVMEEFQIAAADPGVMLYVRNKHAEELKTPSAEKILLFVHGATYPSETAFDLQLNGLLMDYIAQAVTTYTSSFAATEVDSTRGNGCTAGPERTIARTSCSPWRGRGLHSQTARRPEIESDGLVVGHEHDGLVYRAA